MFPPFSTFAFQIHAARALALLKCSAQPEMQLLILFLIGRPVCEPPAMLRMTFPSVPFGKPAGIKQYYLQQSRAQAGILEVLGVLAHRKPKELLIV